MNFVDPLTKFLDQIERFESDIRNKPVAKSAYQENGLEYWLAMDLQGTARGRQV